MFRLSVFINYLHDDTEYIRNPQTPLQNRMGTGGKSIHVLRTQLVVESLNSNACYHKPEKRLYIQYKKYDV